MGEKQRSFEFLRFYEARVNGTASFVVGLSQTFDTAEPTANESVVDALEVFASRSGNFLAGIALDRETEILPISAAEEPYYSRLSSMLPRYVTTEGKPGHIVHPLEYTSSV